MFMGQDLPVSASAAGGVYQYKDGRTAPDTINHAVAGLRESEVLAGDHGAGKDINHHIKFLGRT